MKKVIYKLVFNQKKLLNEDGKALIQVELEQKDLEMIFNGECYNLDDLQIINNVSQLLFTDFMKKEIDESHLKNSTKKNHYSTLSIIRLFQNNLILSELSYNFLCDFENFLIHRKYHRNTIAKHMRHLKRYINLAIKKDLFDMNRNPFRKYQIRSVESPKIHLSPEELYRLEQIDLSAKKGLRRCLDMFLFCCYTGLRFSDASRIRTQNFRYIDGKLWLFFSSTKTDTDTRLPIYLLFNGKAVAIYNKYMDEPNFFNINSNANSNINKQLQEIARLSGIKKITFHTARHTNATLLLYKGAHITTVQKLLGHKSVKTTEIYGKIMDMTIIRDLEKMYQVPQEL
ncbi:integrase [Parabacteroides sp. PF5-5]|uniref:tyrosine-type recombinase/integrase n=1 Tax=unclassified Parabacteroides TaxID=2649774 RepID=UPI002474C106|nr:MULTISPECIES: site-specific integrase [unclassified Parabacteroides]MDH6304437.1 integrase [Parabacteroides sp. PH5-39]MDH6315410.1 integrase [Parabacteroides sp. PF5-13]MDH6319096.1 integrase [Parabacteroides sp. PH5-13]MDH6322826.1 integrase [Parabacteroides sp. PH5-8]MDH6326602.1 integrase [Parabacteroides sp. PH5-41]